jgi:hypothetical protein
MFMQNFSSLACSQMDLDTYLTFFQDKFKIFLNKILTFPNLKKFCIEITKRHLLPNFEPFSIF